MIIKIDTNTREVEVDSLGIEPKDDPETYKLFRSILTNHLVGYRAHYIYYENLPCGDFWPYPSDTEI